jgi:D-alanyl-D-alanine carboxypeptidase
MSRGGAFGQWSLRWGALGLTAFVLVFALTNNADARRGHRPRGDAGQSYQPSYSSIVVDVNSGAVMQATNADSPRHPASLTKIMTLYLLFERLEQGKLKLNTELPVSAHASSQAPSKLDLKPGETIRVETAIRAIVTKSANDVAVIVAEALGGDEPSFAKLMTAKARALGMTQTVYRNASGLPEDQQITTARDQAILGRAIQDRFPNYYTYFATRTFDFRGKSTTITCSVSSTVLMASRPVTSTIPALTSSLRFAVPTTTWWRLYLAAVPQTPATRASGA